MHNGGGEGKEETATPNADDQRNQHPPPVSPQQSVTHSDTHYNNSNPTTPATYKAATLTSNKHCSSSNKAATATRPAAATN